ncbi:hypothetical protein HDU97_001604 [Phlyctochytrium planicorne]|nr:hypothetical protein HDU97_001604 [Phlyctochytrium planicorne]
MTAQWSNHSSSTQEQFPGHFEIVASGGERGIKQLIVVQEEKLKDSGIKTPWQSDLCCNWEGNKYGVIGSGSGEPVNMQRISCDETGRITEMWDSNKLPGLTFERHLNGMKLSGTVPKLSQFQALKAVNIGSNQFSKIPEDIFENIAENIKLL